MGKQNIQRLKTKVGFKKESADVDIYFEIIDRIYYQNQGNVERFDEIEEITTWFFEDGRIISLDIIEVMHLSLFLTHFYADADEQLMSLEDLEKTYFLEENEWKISN